jgi:hypothetical protein
MTQSDGHWWHTAPLQSGPQRSPVVQQSQHILKGVSLSHHSGKPAQSCIHLAIIGVVVVAHCLRTSSPTGAPAVVPPPSLLCYVCAMQRIGNTIIDTCDRLHQHQPPTLHIIVISHDPIMMNCSNSKIQSACATAFQSSVVWSRGLAVTSWVATAVWHTYLYFAAVVLPMSFPVDAEFGRQGEPSHSLRHIRGCFQPLHKS